MRLGWSSLGRLGFRAASLREGNRRRPCPWPALRAIFLRARKNGHARSMVIPALVGLAVSLCGAAGAQEPLALLPQNASRLQGSARPAEEKEADRAARALARERREGARRIRLAQIDLIERLMQMSPEQRQRFLRENPRVQRLPPPQRRRIHQLMQRMSQLSSGEQTLLLERYRLFLDLTPEKQRQARRIYEQWRMLEPTRRRDLLREVEQLREATPEERDKRLQSKEFEDSYNSQEQRILRGLADLYQ